MNKKLHEFVCACCGRKFVRVGVAFADVDPRSPFFGEVYCQKSCQRRGWFVR